MGDGCLINGDVSGYSLPSLLTAVTTITAGSNLSMQSMNSRDLIVFFGIISGKSITRFALTSKNFALQY